MLGKVVHSGTHTGTPTHVYVCVSDQLQQHFPKAFFISWSVLIWLHRGLEDNQHETLAHVARGCYVACNRASPNGAIILNISIITAASSLFLSLFFFFFFTNFNDATGDIRDSANGFLAFPAKEKRTSEHDHTSLVLNHTWFNLLLGFVRVQLVTQSAL